MTATAADNVQETSVSTGAGNLTTSSLNGRRRFSDAFGTGSTPDVFYYFITSAVDAAWEVGTGHMSAVATLVRDTVIQSSNSNLHVSFGAGVKYVCNDLPASLQMSYAATAAAGAATATAKAILTAADAVSTAADRVQTGLDRVATAADRVQTGLDRVATAADRVQTGLDSTQTGLDRTACDADVISAAASAAAASASASFDTIAHGLAATVDGQYFGVRQAAGFGVDIYQNVSAAAVFVTTAAFGAGVALKQSILLEQSPLVCTQLPTVPTFDINPVDAQFLDATTVPSRGTAPSRNKFHSPLFTVSLGGTATTTYNYAIGPDGVTQNAHRVQLPDTSAFVVLGGVPDGKTVVLKMKVKSAAGAGSQSIKDGLLVSAMTVFAISEAGWTDVDLTLTASGNDGIVLFSNGTAPLDYLWTSPQIFDPTDTIPAPADDASSQYALVPGGSTNKLSFPGTIPFVTNYSISNYKGRIPLSADGIADASIAEGTFLIPVNETGASATFASVLLTPNFGSTDYNTLGFGTSGGLVRATVPGADTNVNPNVGTKLKIQGVGWTVLGGRFTASASEVFLEEIPLTSGNGGGPIATPYLMFGGAGFNDGNTFAGEVGPALYFPTSLSDADYAVAVQALLDRLSLQGASTATSFRNFLFFDGDSNSVGFGNPGGSFVSYLPALFTPSLNQRNFGAGSAVLGTPSDAAGTNSIFGRLAAHQRCIELANKRGRNVVSGFLIGTNNNGSPNMTYMEQAYAALHSAGAAKVIACTIPSRTGAGFDANKDVTNAAIRVFCAANSYMVLCDFAANANLGADGAYANLTYFQADGIHLANGGHTLAATILHDAILPVLI